MRQTSNQVGYKSNQLKWIDLIFVILPLALWALGGYFRPVFIRSQCSQQPTLCTKEQVLKIDQLSIGMGDGRAEEYSNITQTLSGIAAFSTPLVWNSTLAALGRLTPISAASAIVVESLILLEGVAWNGVFKEIAHITIQRPRPFVYQDPAQLGESPAHYTSFYSGHTSFASVTLATLFFILFYRRAPSIILFLFAITWECLVFSTGYFRILAGRHFLTDVLFGAFAGILIAWIITSVRRKRIFSDRSRSIIEQI